MSKLETPLTRRFWQETGGTLVEEFLAVPPGIAHGKRLIDGIIVLGGAFECRTTKDVDIKGKHIVVIQTKASRLGMYVLGQAIVSARLMERFQPTSIRSVVVCTKGDAILEPLAKQYGVEVIIYSKTKEGVDHG